MRGLRQSRRRPQAGNLRRRWHSCPRMSPPRGSTRPLQDFCRRVKEHHVTFFGKFLDVFCQSQLRTVRRRYQIRKVSESRGDFTVELLNPHARSLKFEGKPHLGAVICDTIGAQQLALPISSDVRRRVNTLFGPSAATAAAVSEFARSHRKLGWPGLFASIAPRREHSPPRATNCS